MKNISQVILLSTSCLIWYEADNVCASVNLFSGIPKSGTHNTLHTTPYLAYPHLPHLRAQFGNQWRHPRTHSQSDAARPGDPGENIESLFNLDVRIKSEHDIRVASVCFITDTGECAGDGFGKVDSPNSGSGNSGGFPDNSWRPGEPALDNDESCQALGYTKEPCSEGKVPSRYCPYDSSYHAVCVCLPEYSQICTSPNQGVGESCDGKYEECCNTCPGYDYTSVPDGFEILGECDSCDGKKYKVKCPPSYISNAVCGANGGKGVCADDTGTYYKECSCPLNYEWNAAQKKCVCSMSFKYTCTGANMSGSGESCDGKYSKCRCASGYVWNGASGTCDCANRCTLSSCPSGYICEKEVCSGKYCKTGCVADSEWFNERDEKCYRRYLGECYSAGRDKMCNIGDIVNSDGTCTSKKVVGKTPVAVFIASEGLSCRYAMSIERAAENIKWAAEAKMVLYNSSGDDFYRAYNYTQRLIKEGDANAYPAAWAAVNYAPLAAPETKGKWFLPVDSMFDVLGGYNEAVRNGFTEAGGTPLAREFILSVNEEAASSVWGFSIYSYWQGSRTSKVDEQATVSGSGAKYPHTVRPVIRF